MPATSALKSPATCLSLPLAGYRALLFLRTILKLMTLLTAFKTSAAIEQLIDLSFADFLGLIIVVMLAF